MQRSRHVHDAPGFACAPAVQNNELSLRMTAQCSMFMAAC